MFWRIGYGNSVGWNLRAATQTLNTTGDNSGWQLCFRSYPGCLNKNNRRYKYNENTILLSFAYVITLFQYVIALHTKVVKLWILECKEYGLPLKGRCYHSLKPPAVEEESSQPESEVSIQWCWMLVSNAWLASFTLVQRNAG